MSCRNEAKSASRTAHTVVKELQRGRNVERVLEVPHGHLARPPNLLRHRTLGGAASGPEGGGLNLEVGAGGFGAMGRAMSEMPCKGHALPQFLPPQRDGKRRVICPRCGGWIPCDDLTETMLETLAQLAQFGLDAEGRPLLERRAQDRS